MAITYAVVSTGKFTGVVYQSITPNVEEWLHRHGVSAIAIDRELVNVGTSEAPDYGTPTIQELSAGKVNEIELARDAAIVRPIASAALGSDHVYNTSAESRNFLNNLITLGGGGKFTCTDAQGLKCRRLHTNAQLIALANDVEVHVSAQFDYYETKLSEIDAVSNASAPTYADFDAIVW